MASIWRNASTINDLGRAMALWIEGRIPTCPGYLAGEVDEETTHLTGFLAQFNRAGFLTTCSQPGYDGTAWDGRLWRQRAAVQGYMAAGSPLLRNIIRASQRAGLTVIARGPGTSIGPSGGVVVTERDGQPCTGFGSALSRRDLDAQWNGIGRAARRHLFNAGVAVAVVDPVWGRDDRLWNYLTHAITA